MKKNFIKRNMKFSQLSLMLAAAILCVSTNSLKSQGQKTDYFPTHIGDKWFYEHRTGGVHGTHWANKIIEVKDTTSIEGKSYYVFEDRLYDIFYEPGRIYLTTHYYRKADNGDVLKFSPLVNREQLYYTFQKDSLYRSYLYDGEPDLVYKWRITLDDTSTLIRIPSGNFQNCYDYSFDLLIDDNHIGLFTERALAPDLGFIFEGAEGDLNFLVGAYINGTLFGDTTLTSVEEISQSPTPNQPVLYQNYPNPFKHTTQIFFSVPTFWLHPISVAVFDILGREIATFTPVKLSTGHQAIPWNGKTNSGEEVGNGIYIIRLNSGRFSQSIKIHYLK
ncbi:T9SS C-terminal target domain-containing protein [candidate division KSB1 bacterium]|nr:MAG: T9SS C-terminal target domain-containing protein [candidate division KSB1 bacterium]MBC6947138.1 T9SS C-terminal target domain-containing protein [candidate division KSB1 bacterium]MCE7944785.1 T9SS C-terminal target domain-containing protein [Chlorobi bacterium CHB1]MDL1877137.1 T9SS type A sorting domain-containing protein [Cytophagia bacterium CHB2]